MWTDYTRKNREVNNCWPKYNQDLQKVETRRSQTHAWR